MNFELTEEQNLIRETVRDFAEREIKPVAKELDEKAEFSHDLTNKMGELGIVRHVSSRKIRRTGAGLSFVCHCRGRNCPYRQFAGCHAGSA